MCNHDRKIPYYYGPMNIEMMEDINNRSLNYGGLRKTPDLPESFCLDCLEDIYY